MFRLGPPANFLRRASPSQSSPSRQTVRVPGWMVVSYVKGAYPKEYTGVACYDHVLRTIVPVSKTITTKEALEKHCRQNAKTIVVADNHTCLDVPTQIPCIVVHHGCAQLHGQRDPSWGARNALLMSKQRKMWEVRHPANTCVVSCSRICSEWFATLYKQVYQRFKRFEVPHMSALELHVKVHPKEPSQRDTNRPVVCGDWRLPHKGSDMIDRVKALLQDEFEFRSMQIKPPTPFDAKTFAKAKADFYRQCDMVLCLSSHEGNSYFMLDALYCGLILVSTDVGLAAELDPKHDGVIMDWRLVFSDQGAELVANEIRRAWKDRSQFRFTRQQYDQRWARNKYVPQMQQVLDWMTRQ